jgi:hypothetical protein
MKSQLLLALSCVDCLSSTAWAFTTIPVEQTYLNGDSTNIYGARGNKATCKAQGFFIQLGLAAPFCNLALAVYYMLMIIYGWRENQIKKYGLWMVGLPLFIGLALACASIPFYGNNLPVCYVDYFIFFLTIPIVIVIFFETAIMFTIYWKVYNQERRVRRWIVRSNVQSLPRKVFWQCFWYLMCFYVSWPIVLGFVNTANGSFNDAFGFYCTAMILMPLQGFLNFIAYSRHQILCCMKEHNMGLSYLRAFGFKSWPASSVTTTGVIATLVEDQYELKERNSAKHCVAASETGLGTGQGEKQTVNSETVDRSLGDGNKHEAQ